MPHGNIDAVPGNINNTSSRYLNTVMIDVCTYMLSGNINTITFKINLYAQ